MAATIAAKITYFFSGGGKAGWTEGFYITASDLANALTLATGAFVPKRLALLHPNYRLDEVRVSDDSPSKLRDSLVKAYNGASGKGTYPILGGDINKAEDSEQAWDALLCRSEAGADTRRAYDIRGLPRNVVDGNGVYSPEAIWVTRFNQFSLTFLAAPQFLLKRRTYGAVQQVPGISILDGGKGVMLTFQGAVPAGFVRDARIQLQGFAGTLNLNQIWRIQNVNGLEVTTYLRPKKILWGPTTLLGTARTVGAEYAALTSLIPERGVKRDTGRPSGEPVGRRKARAS